MMQSESGPTFHTAHTQTHAQHPAEDQHTANKAAVIGSATETHAIKVQDHNGAIKVMYCGTFKSYNSYCFRTI